MTTARIAWKAWGVLFLVLSLPGTARAEAGSDRVFALDTLTLETARAADSLRQATAAAAAAETAARASGAGTDTAGEAAASLAAEGTREGRGSLSGRVASEARGTVVAGVRVIVAGRNLSVETDADGRFAIPDLEPGTYSLFLYHGSYAPLTAEGLEVTAGRDLSRRLLLPDKALQGEAVRITGTAGKASEAGMLFAQKNAPSVSDGISSEQISKSPDGDAAAALKRVTGISIAGDGLVYVRGLGERYVNMQLNGLTISSPNPEKRVVPLDLFPTSLLENLSVSKTFTADQPAEFAGGSLQLRTKDYPDKRLFSFSMGAGYEPGSTFGTFRTYEGGRWDFLGIDDGTRAFPAAVPDRPFDDREGLGDSPEENKERQQRILRALPNVWTPRISSVPLNQSYGLALGNKIPLGGERIFGWLVGANYSGKWGVDEETVGRVRLDGEDVVYRDVNTNEISKESIQWGTLGTATYEPSSRHKIRLNFMINRDWEDEVVRLYGYREGYDTALFYELTNTQQTLMNGQIEGEHRLLSREGPKLNWTAAMTGASRVEPDRRTSRYFLADPEDSDYNPDFPYLVAATQGFQDRYWFELQERGWGGKLDLEVPVSSGWLQEGSKLKAGAFLFSKHRTYDVHRLSYFAGPLVLNSDLGYGPYEDYMGAFNGASDSGWVNNLGEREKDNYQVDDIQWALHAQGDWVLSESWRAIAGLRLISATVEGESHFPVSERNPPEIPIAECDSIADRCKLSFGYRQVSVLPAVSLVHALTPDQNLRVSWTRTFSFPEYREMAPLLFYSFQEGQENVGNVELKPTDINNYDARWEWFPTASELLAFSAFFKHFKNPVEARINEAGSNNRADFVNAPSALLWGLESEARFDWMHVHEMLDDFQSVINYTYIHSEVEGERKRTLQGQSPYLINIIQFYEPFDGKSQFSLLYNRFGSRLIKIGVGNFPDVFEEARESLEFAYTQKYGKHWKSKFTAKNLTDAVAEQTQGGLTVKKTRPGRSFSFGVSYAF